MDNQLWSKIKLNVRSCWDKQRTVCKGPPVLSSQGVEELGKFQRRAVRVIRTGNEEEKSLQPGREMMSRVVSGKNL